VWWEIFNSEKLLYYFRPKNNAVVSDLDIEIAERGAQF